MSDDVKRMIEWARKQQEICKSSPNVTVIIWETAHGTPVPCSAAELNLRNSGFVIIERPDRAQAFAWGSIGSIAFHSESEVSK